MITYTDAISGKTIDAPNLTDAVSMFRKNAIAGPVHPATEADGATIWCVSVYHKDTGNRVGHFVWPRREAEATA